MSHVDEGLLHAFTDGAIRAGDDGYEQLNAHLELCADCRDRLAQARELRDQARDVLAHVNAPMPLPADFEDVLRRAGRSVPKPGAGSRTGRRRTIVIAWAASLGVAVGAGWMARSLRTQLDDEIAPTVTVQAAEPSITGDAEDSSRDARATQQFAAIESDSERSAIAGESAEPAAQPARTDAVRLASGAGAATDDERGATRAAAAAADTGNARAAVAEERTLAGLERIALDNVVVTGTPRRGAEVTAVVGAPAIRSVLADANRTDAPALEQRLARVGGAADVARVTGVAADVARGEAEAGTRAAPPVPLPPVQSFRETTRQSPPPRAGTPERSAAEPARDRSVLSRLFGGNDGDRGGRGWRAISAADAERRLGRSLSLLPGLAVLRHAASEEAGIWTVRTMQRTIDGVAIEVTQWFDPVTARLRAAEASDEPVLVRTTERADGTNMVFADLPDGSHVSLHAELALDELTALASRLRPATPAQR